MIGVTNGRGFVGATNGRGFVNELQNFFYPVAVSERATSVL